MKKCPACNSDSDESELIERDFIEIHGKPHFYSVNLCLNCGLVFSKSRTANDDLYTINLDLEKEHGHQISEPKPVNKSAWNYSKKAMQVAELYDNLTGIKKVKYLEIGASDGTLFKMLRTKFSNDNRKIEATLVESSGAARQCSSIQGCNVFSKSIYKVENLEKHSFDIIVLSHCLEHFEKPGELISSIHKYLKPEGLLYIEVPDGLRNDSSIASPLSYYHVSNFNLINLSKMIQASGYNLLDTHLRDDYPGIRVIAKRGLEKIWRGFQPGEDAIEFNISSSAIKRWLKLRSEIFHKFQEVTVYKNLLIYGTGAHTVALMRKFPELLESDYIQFCDSNPRIKKFWGRDVLIPSDLQFTNFEKVIISSYAYQKDIENILLDLGCPPNKIYKFYDKVFSYVS